MIPSRALTKADHIGQFRQTVFPTIHLPWQPKEKINTFCLCLGMSFRQLAKSFFNHYLLSSQPYHIYSFVSTLTLHGCSSFTAPATFFKQQLCLERKRVESQTPKHIKQRQKNRNKRIQPSWIARILNTHLKDGCQVTIKTFRWKHPDNPTILFFHSPFFCKISYMKKYRLSSYCWLLFTAPEK